jgi:hypothetical protein
MSIYAYLCTFIYFYTILHASSVYYLPPAPPPPHTHTHTLYVYPLAPGLSESGVDLLEQLMHLDPRRRIRYAHLYLYTY